MLWRIGIYFVRGIYTLEEKHILCEGGIYSGGELYTVRGGMYFGGRGIYSVTKVSILEVEVYTV